MPDALLNAKKLRLVQHLGQDYRGMPVDAARQLGIPAAATPLVNYITVAEHVWAFVLNWLKRLPAIREWMRTRDYPSSWGMFPGVQYAGDVTLGLLGMGEIARPIAKYAQAFDMPVIYWDIQRFPELEDKYNLRYVEWDEIFAQSDILSVQLALNDQTKGIIGARRAPSASCGDRRSLWKRNGGSWSRKSVPDPKGRMSMPFSGGSSLSG